MQVFLYPLYGFISQSRVFHPDFLKTTIFVFKNDFVYELTPEDEKYEVYKYMFRQVKKDKKYLLKKKKYSEKIMKQVLKHTKHFEKNKLNKEQKIQLKEKSDYDF